MKITATVKGFPFYLMRYSAQRGAAKLVLMILATYADKYGICWPSEQRIADQCGFSVRYVRKLIVKLEASNSIKVFRGKRYNRYRVHVPKPAVGEKVTRVVSDPDDYFPQPVADLNPNPDDFERVAETIDTGPMVPATKPPHRSSGSCDEDDTGRLGPPILPQEIKGPPETLKLPQCRGVASPRPRRPALSPVSSERALVTAPETFQGDPEDSTTWPDDQFDQLADQRLARMKTQACLQTGRIPPPPARKLV